MYHNYSVNWLYLIVSKLGIKIENSENLMAYQEQYFNKRIYLS